MELSFSEFDGPALKDSIISVRAGDVRRQAPLAALKGRTLKFPKIVNFVKVDVLKPVFRGEQQVLSATGGEEQEYRVVVPGQLGDEKKVTCTMTVKKTSDSQSVPPSPVQNPDKNSEAYQTAAAGAKDYLEQHDLLAFVQELLEKTIEKRPENPRQFIMNDVWRSMGDTENSTGEEVRLTQGQIETFKLAQQKLEKCEQMRKELAAQLDTLQARVAEETPEQRKNRFEELAPAAFSSPLQEDEYKSKCAELEEARKQNTELQKVVDELKNKMESWPLLQDKFAQLNEAEKSRLELQEKYKKLEEKFLPMLTSLKEKQEKDAIKDAGTQKSVPQVNDSDKKLLQEKCEELEQAEKKREQLEKKLKEMEQRFQDFEAQQKQNQEVLEQKYKLLEKAEKDKENLEQTLERIKGQVENLKAFKEMKNSGAALLPKPGPGEID